MDQAKWNKINAILDKALDYENSRQQQQIIRESCNNDEELYNQVSFLLRSIKQAKESNFLDFE